METVCLENREGGIEGNKELAYDIGGRKRMYEEQSKKHWSVI